MSVEGVPEFCPTQSYWEEKYSYPDFSSLSERDFDKLMNVAEGYNEMCLLNQDYFNLHLGLYGPMKCSRDEGIQSAAHFEGNGAGVAESNMVWQGVSGMELLDYTAGCVTGHGIEGSVEESKEVLDDRMDDQVVVSIPLASVGLCDFPNASKLFSSSNSFGLDEFSISTLFEKDLMEDYISNETDEEDLHILQAHERMYSVPENDYMKYIYMTNLEEELDLINLEKGIPKLWSIFTENISYYYNENENIYQYEDMHMVNDDDNIAAADGFMGTELSSIGKSHLVDDENDKGYKAIASSNWCKASALSHLGNKGTQENDEISCPVPGVSCTDTGAALSDEIENVHDKISCSKYRARVSCLDTGAAQGDDDDRHVDPGTTISKTVAADPGKTGPGELNIDDCLYVKIKRDSVTPKSSKISRRRRRKILQDQKLKIKSNEAQEKEDRYKDVEPRMSEELILMKIFVPHIYGKLMMKWLKVSNVILKVFLKQDTYL